MTDAASFRANSSRSNSSQPQSHGDYDKDRSSNNTNNANKSSLICGHCNKQGHTAEKCYRLYGFPPSFKFTKNKRRFAAQVDTSTCDSSSGSQSASSSSLPTLSLELCAQLMNLMKAAQSSESAPSAANFAGLFSE